MSSRSARTPKGGRHDSAGENRHAVNTRARHEVGPYRAPRHTLILEADGLTVAAFQISTAEYADRIIGQAIAAIGRAIEELAAIDSFPESLSSRASGAESGKQEIRNGLPECLSSRADESGTHESRNGFPEFLSSRASLPFPSHPGPSSGGAVSARRRPPRVPTSARAPHGGRPTGPLTRAPRGQLFDGRRQEAGDRKQKGKMGPAEAGTPTGRKGGRS
jgi:hypothetical protein